MTDVEVKSKKSRKGSLQKALANIQKIKDSEKKTQAKITMDRKDYNFLLSIQPAGMSMQELIRRIIVNSYNK